MTKSQKSLARLEARVDAEIKARWQQAADLQGITLTDFIITSLQESASKIIQQHQTMKLSKKDTEAFVEAILNPSEPNENLIAAVTEYKELISD
ncbi:MAG: DUF1778 domain-containing protein [Xenococcaceae cyanobacterium MO_207.B15]|nr:DUF1778 domain-containing protein [Xenococcaceae cyanobacterium MO_207.B15]